MPFGLDLGSPYLPRFVGTVVLVALVLGAVRVLRHLLARIVSDPTLRYRGYKLIGRIAAAILVVAFVVVWAPVRRDMLTIFTVIGTGLAISTREALLSAVGWLHLVIRAPYRQGDRIEIHGARGDVVDIRLLHTTLVEVGGWAGGDQSTGRLVHVPNNWVFQYPIHNDGHGFGFVWNELTFTVTPESDWRAAQEILERLVAETSPTVEAAARAALERMASEFIVEYSILTPFVYVHVSPKGISLTLRYLCEVRRRRGIDHALTVSFLDALAAHGGIHLAEE